MKNEDAPFKIFRLLKDGDELYVTSRADLAEAEKFVAMFIDGWPGKYAIRGPESLNLDWITGMWPQPNRVESRT